jgi:hypothetical protein
LISLDRADRSARHETVFNERRNVKSKSEYESSGAGFADKSALSAGIDDCRAL